MADLTPRMREIRDALAPDILKGLYNTKSRIEAGWPATDEDRKKLDAEIEHWSAK